MSRRQVPLSHPRRVRRVVVANMNVGVGASQRRLRLCPWPFGKHVEARFAHPPARRGCTAMALSTSSSMPLLASLGCRPCCSPTTAPSANARRRRWQSSRVARSDAVERTDELAPMVAGLLDREDGERLRDSPSAEALTLRRARRTVTPVVIPTYSSHIRLSIVSERAPPAPA